MPRVKCPNCKSSNTCRILYGEPAMDDKLEAEANAGRVHFGGCIVAFDDPNRHCNDCEIKFDTKAPNIYLDIDGVLLAKDLTPAHHVNEFLQKVLEEYPYTTYWLTTHCQGDANVPIQRIGNLFDAETVELMGKIKPTKWNTAKTRAIDFTRPFLWFDDNLLYEERQTLIKHDVLDNLIRVDLSKDPDRLGKFVTTFPLPINVESVYEPNK